MMEKSEQRRIAQEIIKGFTESLLNAVEKMPEDWNGFEIRQLAADIANHHINYRPMERKRLREYNNECLVRNIP
jgi:hypothetical protein